MGKPILYAAELSPAVRSVLLVTKAMDLELEIRSVNLLAGEHLKAEYLKLNPQHTVPTLDDNGLIVWESHAICAYLVDKYGRGSVAELLYPKNLHLRARIQQRMHFNSSVLFTKARTCTEAVFYGCATEFPQRGIDEIYTAYDFMEAFLKDDPFFVGQHITIADYCLVANFSTTQTAAPLDAVRHPKLAAWFGRMTALPFYEEVNGKRNELFRQFVLGKIESNKKLVAAEQK